MVKLSLIILICWLAFPAYSLGISQGYEFGPGDSLSISVYQESDLAYSGQISQQGLVDLPLLGSVNLSGLTQKEAKSHLEELLKDGYLVSPSVSIQVSSYRPFFIYGEVRNPGSYKYQPDITLEQVIALSGGLKDRASRKIWTIQRGIDKSTFVAQSSTIILPGDVIKIEKSFF
ncbi:polysaccharide export protein [Pseudoalteromonas sp. C2R02]|uniref:polysaccharide biosynthesis/export family protein n=1 Tax=Pseudoalteromonas sp. C2R02 TaxID=2841565 RepID=UPI001C09E784|nr:polysaccharide biosynthesis/export family protein [Pseudoalteromonas sp. C2R02]MBU2970656.1 polysaccharide export protein [Pseudoalteromonas sp. C2R02]